MDEDGREAFEAESQQSGENIEVQTTHGAHVNHRWNKAREAVCFGQNTPAWLVLMLKAWLCPFSDIVIGS